MFGPVDIDVVNICPLLVAVTNDRCLTVQLGFSLLEHGCSRGALRALSILRLGQVVLIQVTLGHCAVEEAGWFAVSVVAAQMAHVQVHFLLTRLSWNDLTKVSLIDTLQDYDCRWVVGNKIISLLGRSLDLLPSFSLLLVLLVSIEVQLALNIIAVSVLLGLRLVRLVVV